MDSSESKPSVLDALAGRFQFGHGRDRSGTDGDRVRGYPVVELVWLFLSVRVIDEHVRRPKLTDELESLCAQIPRSNYDPNTGVSARIHHTSGIAVYHQNPAGPFSPQLDTLDVPLIPTVQRPTPVD